MINKTLILVDETPDIKILKFHSSFIYTTVSTQFLYELSEDLQLKLKWFYNVK